MRQASRVLTTLLVTSLAASLMAQVAPAPDRRSDEGEGPYDRLILRGAIVIDGSGAPPRGPTNVIISGNRIASIGGPPARADRVIDARGMYLLPGFVDMHAHCGGKSKAPEAEYVYKLWMAHGITTVRGVPLGGHKWTETEKARSAANETTAPRIFNYQRPRAHSPETRPAAAPASSPRRRPRRRRGGCPWPGSRGCCARGGGA